MTYVNRPLASPSTTAAAAVTHGWHVAFDSYFTGVMLCTNKYPRTNRSRLPLGSETSDDEFHSAATGILYTRDVCHEETTIILRMFASWNAVAFVRRRRRVSSMTPVYIITSTLLIRSSISVARLTPARAYRPSIVRMRSRRVHAA